MAAAKGFQIMAGIHYTFDMMGSYSIKKVLPALIPAFSYENLEINKGDMASIAFERLYSGTDESVIAKTRKDSFIF